MYICIIYLYLRINSNRQQKSVLLIVHNSQRQTKSYSYTGTLLTLSKIFIPVVYFIYFIVYFIGLHTFL